MFWMLVDAWQLRVKGEPLPKGQTGLYARGFLRLQRGGMITGMRGEGPYRDFTAYLHSQWPPTFPGQSGLPPLHRYQVTRLDEDGIVILGNELVMEGGAYQTYRQAWACKPVRDQAPAQQRTEWGGET